MRKLPGRGGGFEASLPPSTSPWEKPNHSSPPRHPNIREQLGPPERKKGEKKRQEKKEKEEEEGRGGRKIRYTRNLITAASYVCKITMQLYN